ncbi:MAG: acyl-CoA/acyl-ACP dehydrogenase [Deltaproteobacteria bacterium]|nr:acyl-CoA/acyl-ACP dehydrogenase [Deltaproteobacteria bacterium]
MDFDLSTEQKMIVKSAKEIAKKFGPEYWYEKEEEHEFPRDFFEALGDLGFLGLGISDEYDGTAMTLTEGALALEALCSNGGGAAPVNNYLMGVLGGLSIAHHGNEAQKQKYLPRIAEGEIITCFGLTEPDAGTNTLNIATFAQKDGNNYIINGNKMFITNARESQLMLLVARTTPRDEAVKKSKGISLFLVELPNNSIKSSYIPKHGMNYSPTYDLGISDLKVPEENLLGEEGNGWFHLMGTINPERILIAAGAVGTGRIAIKHAVSYAKERVVFDGPIGAYQGIQFPLAAAHAKLECAWMAVLKAATLHDQKKNAKQVGDIANMAKYLAVEACIEATYHAMQTLGGYGYAKEYHIERWWREVQLFRLAPITQQMTLNYTSEHILGLPRSY